MFIETTDNINYRRRLSKTGNSNQLSETNPWFSLHHTVFIIHF